MGDFVFGFARLQRVVNLLRDERECGLAARTSIAFIMCQPDQFEQPM